MAVAPRLSHSGAKAEQCGACSLCCVPQQYLAGMSCLGDLLAQKVTGTGAKQSTACPTFHKAAARTGGLLADLKNAQLARTARMGGFGFLFYGPFQQFWYAGLAQRFPGVSTPAFLTKARLMPAVQSSCRH